MAAISATNSATPSLQSVLMKSQLELARREADQAQNRVEYLRAQVTQAETDAQSAQNQVRDLTRQKLQTDPTYQSQVKSSLAANPSAEPVNAGASGSVTAGSSLVSPSSSALASRINRPIQVTGRFVNQSA
jgi:capsule polysaccharide export protein KpsE/RkpR